MYERPTPHVALNSIKGGRARCTRDQLHTWPSIVSKEDERDVRELNTMHLCMRDPHHQLVIHVHALSKLQMLVELRTSGWPRLRVA
jgi:hypothetical protein